MNGENKETLNQQVLLKTILINVSNINNKEHLNYQTSLEMITTNKKKKVEKAIESGVNVKGFHTLNKKSNLLNRLERLDCLKKEKS